MKRAFILAVSISLVSMGLFAQEFKDFTRPHKSIRPERPSAYPALLDSYHLYNQQASLKSVADLGMYLDTAQIQLYIEEDQYLPFFNQALIYDLEGRIILMETIILNAQTFLWEKDSKTEYSYDGNGNISQVINEDWNTTNESWVPVGKTEYSYDSNNDLIRIIDYDWSVSGNQYINSSKVDRTLDENGLETEALISSWLAPPGEWVDVWKYEYDYTVNESLLLETEYAWDGDAMDWELSWKAEYTYNEDDKLSVTEEFNWDSEASLWTNSWKTNLNYDGNGYVDEQFDSTFLEPSGPWQARGLAEYTYDALFNPLTEVYSQWDEIAAQLVFSSRYEYIYEDGVFLSDLIVPPISWFVADYREQMVSKPLGYVSYEYNTETSSFDPFYREGYLYNEHFPTLIKGFENSPVASIFPNPAREYVTLEFEEGFQTVSFELFDVTGRRVLFKEISNGESLNLEGLQKGLYLYRISEKEHMQTGKLMKK
jgi:hypothetical protein